MSDSCRRTLAACFAVVLPAAAAAQEPPLEPSEPPSDPFARATDLLAWSTPELGAAAAAAEFSPWSAALAPAALRAPDPLDWIDTPAGASGASEEDVDAEGHYMNLYRRFSLSVGGAAYTKFNTNMQISGSTSVGADLDMEDLLGLDDSSQVLRVDARYAFSHTHWLEFSYYDIERDGERVISDDIQVGDVVIPAGLTTTTFDTAIAKLAYRYNFVTDTRTVIGASFGVHLMQLDTSVRSPTFDVQEEFKVDAPLPLIGLHGAYALSSRWRLSAAVEFLQFDIGDYQGLITDTRLTIDHDTFRHLGWGFGFNGFQADAELQGNDNLTTELEYGYQGVMIYLRAYF